VGLQAKNNADHFVTLLCCEKRRSVLGLVRAMALLLDGDCVCVAARNPCKLNQRAKNTAFKVTLWTSSGLSEVVLVTARENMCNRLFIVKVLQQTWWQSSLR